MAGKEGQPHRRPGGSHEGTRVKRTEEQKQRQQSRPPKPEKLHDKPPPQGQN